MTYGLSQGSEDQNLEMGSMARKQKRKRGTEKSEDRTAKGGVLDMSIQLKFAVLKHLYINQKHMYIRQIILKPFFCSRR